MNERNIDDLKHFFLKGELNDAEETELKKLLDDGPNSDEYKAYFEEVNKSHEFKPVSKEDFFRKVKQKRNSWSKAIYWAAASLIFVSTISIVLYNFSNKHKKAYSKSEINQSIEITRLALNSFTTRIEKGVKITEKGIDLSLPYNSLEKINYQNHKK